MTVIDCETDILELQRHTKKHVCGILTIVMVLDVIFQENLNLGDE